uniref:Uncharacterized protein n=1 Tax=Coptotermes formosanus TaxID=36987 RepID=R4V501_COPFO|nr:hypothetical protein [Coptotermes formosanus]
MVADEDMILNAFQTESFQRSLVFPSQVTFSNEVHSSFPIHIAVTHRNVPMFFYMLRPYPDCPKKLRVPSTDPIPRVDLFSQTTKGTIPLEVAVFGLDITMVLLILSFYNENGYSLTDEVLTKLNERLVPKPDQDALSKVKITAISGILSQFSLFALKPEEIFRNWKSDNRFYEKHYLQPPSDQNVHIEPPPPAPEPAQFKCAVCNTEANLFTCQGCGNFFCSSCFPKPFFHPCARTG